MPSFTHRACVTELRIRGCTQIHHKMMWPWCSEWMAALPSPAPPDMVSAHLVTESPLSGAEFCVVLIDWRVCRGDRDRARGGNTWLISSAPLIPSPLLTRTSSIELVSSSSRTVPFFSGNWFVFSAQSQTICQNSSRFNRVEKVMKIN